MEAERRSTKAEERGEVEQQVGQGEGQERVMDQEQGVVKLVRDR